MKPEFRHIVWIVGVLLFCILILGTSVYRSQKQYLCETRHEQRAPLTFRIPMVCSGVVSVAAVGGRTGFFYRNDYRSDSVISTVLPVPDSSRSVFSKLDMDEAFGVWHIRSSHLLMLVVILSSLTFFLGFRYWQRARKIHVRNLFESEAKQYLLDIAGVILLALDAKANVTLINRRGCDILDFADRDIIGKNWFDHFIPSDQREFVGERFSEMMAGHAEINRHVENEVIDRNGRRHMIAWHNVLLLDEQNRICGTLSSGEDITDRRAIEESLRRLEWMLDMSISASSRQQERTPSRVLDLVRLNTQRVILDAVGEDMLADIIGDFLDLLKTSAAVYEVNGDYAAGIVSSGWCRFMDQTSRKLCGTDDNREALSSGKWLCHESCWQEASKAAIETGVPVDIACAGGIRLYAIPIRADNEIIGAINFGYGDPPQEYTVLLELAEKFHVDVKELHRLADDYEHRPPFIIDQAKWRLSASARLIGEMVIRKRIADDLLQAARDWQETFDASRSAIWILDAEQRIIRSNQASDGLFQKSMEEIKGRYCWEVVHGTEEPIPECPIIRARQSHDHESMELQIGARTFDVSVDPIFDEDGRFSRAVHIVTDITSAKQMERDREKLQLQVLQSQKIESVGRLAGGIAHDFNNMLGVIIGYAEFAMQTLTSAESVSTALTEIIKAANRSADLTRRLLGFASRQTVVAQRLNLTETLSGMMSMLRRLISEQILLSYEPGPIECIVKMDPGQIDQILVNLVLNARDAISDNGSITIETDYVLIDEDFCSHHPDCTPGEYAMLAVNDDGCGMDQDLIDHIFEPFYTTKDFGQGSGMGLAVVYGIVKQNDGFITVDSEPDEGTQFSIYLPHVQGDSLSFRRDETNAIPRGKGETILIVEDEQSLLTMVKSVLERHGYVVLTASHPADAITMVESREEPLDMLITDVMLPHMHGRDLARQLTARMPTVKILFMSGYTADVLDCHDDFGADLDFIQKPFTAGSLARKIRHILDSNHKNVR